MNNIIITGCNDCPLLYKSEECQGHAYDCQHPAAHGSLIIGEGKNGPITPDLCPLKTESLTLSFNL